MTTGAITTIGFDADDTLWQNEHFYRLTEAQFAALLADYCSHEDLSRHLLETERRNLDTYGYGIKGFMLSMIETALELTDHKIPAKVIREILECGRDMLSHPVETLPHVRETLATLAGHYRLVLITKGDLFDQERKLAQSGLSDLFNWVEIVSEKDEGTYSRVFSEHGNGPTRSLMVGNSLKSDIIPALKIGAWGVFVPHELNWALEHAEIPDHPRFQRINHLGELSAVLAGIG